MGKETKTNAMRILDRMKIPYTLNQYQCEEFIDGVHVADLLGQSYDESFKTIVTVGKSQSYYVFALPIDKEIDLKKAAKVVGEKNLELLPVKDINKVTGYIRGGCTPIGMKKQYKTGHPVSTRSALPVFQMIVSGGRLGEQILLKPDDLLRAVNGTYADIIKE